LRYKKWWLWGKERGGAKELRVATRWTQELVVEAALKSVFN
jgi:hypothetical protein